MGDDSPAVPDPDDYAVFAREAAASLSRQEQRLDDLRKRALEVIGVAALVFGLFGGFRSTDGLTWPVALALVAFVCLVAIAVVLQLPIGPPWYFALDVDLLREQQRKRLDEGTWNANLYVAGEHHKSYDCNQPRIDQRLNWLATTFALLGIVVLFLVLDLTINNGDSDGKTVPTQTTTATTP